MVIQQPRKKHRGVGGSSDWISDTSAAQTLADEWRQADEDNVYNVEMIESAWLSFDGGETGYRLHDDSREATERIPG